MSSRIPSNVEQILPTDDEPELRSNGVSGTWVIVVVATLGLLAAGGAWLYRYDAQRRPVDFWGFDSHRIMGGPRPKDKLAGPVSVVATLVRPEVAGPQVKPWYDDLFMIVELRYVVVTKKDVTNEPGIRMEDGVPGTLRQALRDYRNFDWSARSWTQPTWRYALRFEQPEVTAEGTKHELRRTFGITLVFDESCKFVRLQSVEKMTALEPAAQQQFRDFFANIFPQGATPPETPEADPVETPPVLTVPNPTGTAGLPPTAPTATSPTATPSATPPAKPTPSAAPSPAAPTVLPSASASPSATARPSPTATAK